MIEFIAYIFLVVLLKDGAHFLGCPKIELKSY